MEIRHGLIKMLGGYTKREYIDYVAKLNALVREVIDKHEMNNAWNQLKQEKKLGRVH